jgi:membrane-bound lytic murein transglycosylase C
MGGVYLFYGIARYNIDLDFSSSSEKGFWMISRRTFLAGCLPVALSACSTSEMIRSIEAAARTGSLQGAARSVATSKATGWVANPKSFTNDLKRFDRFAKKFVHDVVAVWGEDDARTPSPKVYVKYSDTYKTRSVIDFENAIVRVETLDENRLKQAIITTLLSPEDPSSVDLFSDKPVQLGGVPFLYNQVLDQDAKAIRWEWRANNFADYLLRNQQSQSVTLKSGEVKTQYFVEFPLVRDNQVQREHRYTALVQRYGAKYGVERALVYAIIQTESNFNPYAVSGVPAFGLMQIVPTTAGRDAFEKIHGRAGTPSQTYLFNAENNIRMGTAYLNILQTRYLVGVIDPLAREYCVIAAYNGGAGNVLRSFSKDRTQALSIINRMSAKAVYQKLRAKMPAESQRYLEKVTVAKRQYV